MSRTHRGKRSALSEEQRNQRSALKYYINLTAYHDNVKGEIVNVQPTGVFKLFLKGKDGKVFETGCGNQWFLQSTFGVFDSAVPPSYGFDGCVIEYQ